MLSAPATAQDNPKYADKSIRFPDNFIIKAGYQYTGSNYIDAGFGVSRGLGWKKDFPRFYQGLHVGCAVALNRSQKDPSQKFVAPRIGYEVHGLFLPLMARVDASYFLLKRRGTPVMTPSAGLSLAGGILYVAYGYNFPVQKTSTSAELKGHLLSAGVHIPLVLFRMF